MCSVLYTARLLLLSNLILLIRRSTGISPDIYTDPDELAFEVYSSNNTQEKSFFLIQPAMEGSIIAHLGSYNSTHFYKMASINVFLNTHIIFVYKTHSSPLYALCSLENNYLVAQQNTFIFCSFRVYIQSFDSHVFSNSSCTIRTVNETECAAKLDLDFIKMQFLAHMTESLTILVKYNATAYQANYTEPYLHYVERSDITHSLIHQSQVLPPVTAIQKPDFEWNNINHGVSNASLVQIGISGFRLNHEFSLRVAVNRSSQIHEFRLGIQFGSTIRFVRPKPSKFWGIKVIPSQYGVNFRFRNKKPDIAQKLGAQINDKSFMNVAELIMEYIVQENHLFGSNLNHHIDVSSIGSGSRSSVTVPLAQFKSDRLNINNLHGLDDEVIFGNSSTDFESDFNEDNQNMENNNLGINKHNSNNNFNDNDYSFIKQPIIHVKLIHFMHQSNSSKVTLSSLNNFINLNLPRLLMQSNNMHIFVQFEPRDIIEPPWFPAISTPEPRKLCIIGLIPEQHSGPLDNDRSYEFSLSTHSVGRLVDLTRSVFCRPSTSRGLSDTLVDVIISSSPACSISMRQAPPEVENINPPFNDGFLRDLKLSMLTKVSGGFGMRTGWNDQLVLALPSSIEKNYRIPIAPSIYGPISLDTYWPWRDWRGPTVRRWMLEGFQIHTTKRLLRKITSWKIPQNSALNSNNPVIHPQTENESFSGMDRYEQTMITVTARIYTMKPGTGQRIYLGSSFIDKQHSSSSFSIPPLRSEFHTNEDGSGQLMFDITRLLPSWALIVKPIKSYQSSSNFDTISAAYLYRDNFSGRPYLIGRWPGKVELSLVATLGDFQPLATLSIDVVDFDDLTVRQPNSVYTNENIDIVALKAECIDPHLELSGSLNPATTGNSEGLLFDSSSQDTYRKKYSHLFDDKYDGIRTTTIQDYSLPNPHRLNINLIGRSPKSVKLVTAAASSTIRHPQSFKFKLIQSDQNTPRIMDTVGPSVSSAVCPIHLLVINIILSDGSMIGAHTVPKNQLRISSYGSKYVWDPAMLIQPMNDEREYAQNITVPINSLIIWPAVLTDTKEAKFHSLPLAIMDDVFVYIKKSGMVQDPGIPQNPSYWFSKQKKDKISEKILRSSEQEKDSSVASSNTGSWLQFNTLLSLSNTENSFKSNDSKDQYTQTVPLVTYILVIISCSAILLLIISCSIVIILRKRHSRQQKTENKIQFKLLPSYQGHLDEKLGKFDSDEPNDIDDRILSGRLPASHMISSTGDRSKQLNITSTICNINSGEPLISGGCAVGSSPLCPESRTHMVSGRSCSSMGSGNSGTFINNNIKRSMIIDTTANPYLICSESSSSGRVQHVSQHSCSTNLSLVNTPPAMMNYQLVYDNPTSQENWNTPPANPSIHSNHHSKALYYDGGNMDQCVMWSTTHHVDGQPCNGDYTSGLGSLGTAEGCSDEGVPSGIEVNSMSQELNNNNTSGISCYPGSMKYKLDHICQQQRQTPNSFRSVNDSFTGVINNSGNSTTRYHSRDASKKYKNNLLNGTILDSSGVCVGGGSLSGASSGGDTSEYRQDRGHLGSLCQMNRDMNSRSSHIMYSPTKEIDTKLNTVSCSMNAQKVVDLTCDCTSNSSPKNLHMFESFPKVSLHVEQSENIGEKLRKGVMVCENNVLINMRCIPAQDDPRSKLDANFCSNTHDLHSTHNSTGEECDGFSLHVPPMMLLNSQVNSGSVTRSSINSPIMPNRSYDWVEPNSYNPKQPSHGYKRSDSFGMATHRIPVAAVECYKNSDLTPKLDFDSDDCEFSCEKQNLFKRDSLTLVGAVDEMIGDISDITDEGVILQKSANKQAEITCNADNSGMTYLYKIPAPEV
ncbi:hypothetical protein MS3_00007287 [Schistosoma haematobium]|uniref:DUF5735 domain-containing protein n=2 Tax=Schistosoma haematobium TaxID=6185 RepID=A0A922LVY5_SCHHA|nr:hypothetical protein MS3_00007287 [Schistosoma haematobium]KAH9594622.1 hypothetical protein MS3_00007287 [Schistosoma haematobium]